MVGQQAAKMSNFQSLVLSQIPDPCNPFGGPQRLSLEKASQPRLCGWSSL